MALAFTFQVVDNGGVADGGEDTDQSPNTFAFDITNVNDQPVGTDDTATTPEDTPLTVAAGSGLLSNDIDVDGDTLTITQFSVGTVTASAGQTGTIPGVGDITVNADGSYSFTPVANFTGPVPDITYIATDGNGGTTTAILAIEVIPVNDPPVDGNETNTVTEDTALTVADGASGDLLNNASDLDGDTLTISGFTVAGEAGPFVIGTGYLIAGVGTVTIEANGSYSFVPVADYDGAIPVITYTVSDGAGGSDTSTLTLTMTAVNDAPIAQDDAATTPENTPVSGNVLSNDTDVDNPTLTVTFFQFGGTTYGAGSTATIAGVGALVINTDGSYTFTPAPSYDGPVPSATYAVSDGNLTDTAVLQLTITPLNDPPVADDETGTTPEDTPLTVPAGSGLLVGDTDVDGDALAITQFAIAGTTYTAGDTANVTGVGELTINADGSYEFVPAPDYNGPVPVASYTASDGNGGTDQATLTLTVTPVNDAPVAVDDSGSTPEDTTLNGDVFANDTDADGDQLTVLGFQVAGVPGTFAAGSTASIAGVGTVSINADGSYVLVPAANYTGPVPVVTYIVSDGNGGTDTATVSLIVTPVNDPPNATDDTVGTPEDTTLNGNVLDNDTDVDGDTLDVTGFEVDGNTYAPSDTAVISGVGEVTINADGSYVFVPEPGYTGPVPDVTYTVSDGTASDDGTLSIDVVPDNGVGAIDDAATTPEDNTLTGNVVTNDLAPSGDPISVTDFTVAGDPTVHAAGSTATITGVGDLTINANGSYTFVPAANYFGPVPDVTYTATDGTATDTGQLTITVTPVNDPPVVADHTVTTPEDTQVGGSVLAGATDVESDPLTVTQFTVGGVNFTAGQTATIPTVGQLRINVDGSYTFVPFADFNGPVPVAITYTVSDGHGGIDAGALTIDVTPVNDAPVAANDTGTTPEDVTLTVAGPGLLSNDTDVDGNPLGITGFTVAGVPGSFIAGSTATIAGVGALTIDANGGYTFVPAANFNGSVPLVTYTMSDGTLSDTATQAITVTPVNDAPVATDDVGTLAEDTTLTVPAASGLLSNDTDVEGGSLTVTQFEINGIIFGAGTTATIPATGALTINADGSYTFTPVANYNGSVPSVTYTLSDGNGGTDTAVLTINVTPVNDAPTAIDDTATTAEDTTRTGNVLPNDQDIDGDTLSVSQFTIAGDATVYVAGDTATMAGVGDLTINADGSYTFVPAPDYNGPVPVVTYTASDSNGGSDTATLTITITPVNDPPLAVDDTVTTNEDTTLTVPAPGVLLNDVNVDGDTLTIDRFSVAGVAGSFLAGATATVPGLGTLTINANGSYTFVPVANYNGPGPVATYRVTDGALMDTGVLTIIVAPVNDPPVDGNEANTVTEDTVLSVPQGSGLLINSTDIDGATPSVSAFTVAGETGPFTVGSGYLIAGVGTITINADGSYSFAPAANYTGAVPVITYTVSDNAGGTDTSTLTLTMVPVNDPPVDGDETNAVTEDTVLTIPAASGLLINTTDVDGGAPGVSAFTVAGETGPFTVGSGYLIAGVGTITINADGIYSFAPAANYTGAVPVITYTVSDGAGGTDTSTLTLTMVPVNDPPVDGNENNSVTEDTTLTVPSASGLLANTTDVDGGAPSVTAFSIAGETGPFTLGSGYLIAGVGIITINADGSYSFAPAPDYTGAIPVITYTISDGAGGTDTSTLTLTMVPVNDAPVAADDTGTTPEDTTLTGNVLPNDTDIDGDALSVSQFTIAGDATIHAAGDTAVIAGVGELTIDADGSYTFVPAANYNGPVPLATYLASDGSLTDTATLTLTVTPVNDPPVDGDETNTVTEDTVLTVPQGTGLLANTTDVDGGTPSITGFSVAGEAGPFTVGNGYLIAGVGTVTINSDGSYSFAPAPDYTGAIPVITYTVSDGAGGTDTSTLTLTIAPVNDPPVDDNETNLVTEDTVLTVSPASGLLANTTDIDGGAPSVSAFSVTGETGPFTVGSGYLIAGVGTITINADGSYSFAPAVDYAGAIPVITYTVSDGAGGSDTSTLTLTMVPVNDPPVAADDTGTTLEDTRLTGNVLANDTDIDGGGLRVTQFVVDGTTYNPGQTAQIAGIGTLTINALGRYTFIPAVNYNGPVPLASYTVSDGRGGTDTAVLTITVTPVNDPPEPDDGDGTDTDGDGSGDGDGTDIPDQRSVDATAVTPVDVSGYFIDVDGDVLTYSVSGLPAGLSIDPVTGVISGTLPNDASQDSPYHVVVTATDPSGLSATETFAWNVTNPAPVAGDDTASGAEDTAVKGNVLANDSDPDGDAIGFTQFVVDGTTYTAGETATLAGVGTLVINADGTYVFKPVLNYNGRAPVATYTLSDGNGGTDTATLTIRITPVNDAPDIIDDSASGNEDTTISGNVLDNDSDPDGDILDVTGFSVDGDPTAYQPGETATIAGVGSISLEANGDFVFIPAPNYDGPVPNIFYTASDGNGGAGQATLAITITPVDDFVPRPDVIVPDLPAGADLGYNPENVDGAVVEAVRDLNGLNDISDLAGDHQAAERLQLHTFLGGSSTIVIERPGAGDERIQIESIKHAGIIYLQIIEHTGKDDQTTVLSYRLSGADGIPAPAWLRQIGPLTFAGRPDAGAGAVNLILSIIQRDGWVSDHHIRLDSFTGHLSEPAVSEDRGFNGGLAPMFSEQMNGRSRDQDMARLERALGFR